MLIVKQENVWPEYTYISDILTLVVEKRGINKRSLIWRILNLQGFVIISQDFTRMVSSVQ